MKVTEDERKLFSKMGKRGGVAQKKKHKNKLSAWGKAGAKARARTLERRKEEAKG